MCGLQRLTLLGEVEKKEEGQSGGWMGGPHYGRTSFALVDFLCAPVTGSAYLYDGCLRVGQR